MKNYFKSIFLVLLGALLGFTAPNLFKLVKETSMTAGYRDLEMKINVANNEMMIWKTVIAPQQENIAGIALHRHEYARILIPLTQGVLQRRDKDGTTTDYALNIGKPILLPEDTALGFHTDENLGKTPIEVMVLQFTQAPVTVEKLAIMDLNSVIVMQ